MKDIYKEEDFEIPEGVTLSVKSRLVTVKGPRGELTKSLRHINMEIKKISDNKIKLVVWHGARKHVACLRTVRSLIMNMIQGVTKVCIPPTPESNSLWLLFRILRLPILVLLACTGYLFLCLEC